MSDIWKEFANKSPQAEKDAKNVAGFGIFLVAACLGGVFADTIIRAVKRRWPSVAWAPIVVLFGFGYALLRWVPREGVRIIVAGMYGRIGPATWDSMIKPLLAKLNITDAGQLPAPDKKKKGKNPPGNCLDGAANDPLMLDAANDASDEIANAANAANAANGTDEAWVPPPDPVRDIRPLAQEIMANRQMLYDLSGEVFNEMQRRQMVDPNVANETAAEFETVLNDVFRRMAS